MSRFWRTPPTRGGRRSPNERIATSLVFGLLLLGAFGASFALLAGGGIHGATAVHAAVPVAATGALARPAAPHPAVHGDLIVTAANSPFVISPATAGGSTYIQQGNITVQAGGTLVVRDVTLDFAQFVSDLGTLPQRLSHIYTFNDQGTVVLTNATITTDTTILNAYPKLTLDVSAGGQMTATNSSLAFPGWLSADGAGTNLILNQSVVKGNPAIAKLTENLSLLGDTVFAPAMSASAGAHLTLYNSTVQAYYKDNTTSKGMPGPIALSTLQPYTLSSGQSQTFNSWPMPTDSENVTRGDLYPSFAGGTVNLAYQTTGPSTASGSTFTFGVPYALPAINFQSGLGYAQVPIPPAAIAAINAVGPIGWMEATGSFDDPGSIGLHIGTTNSATPVNISVTSIQLTPVLAYNVTASGAATLVTAADSTLDLNWNLTPGQVPPPNVYPPTPWGSNKLLLNGGASAYLASLSIAHGRNGVFFNQSAVVPDASSHAYFYRWAAVPVYANGGVPVIDAQLTAFFSYDASQANNQTATALNSLSTADIALANYATSWDTMHGVSVYGQTAVNGYGRLLLATSVLDQSTLPDGTYLGGYHLAVSLPNGGAAGVQWGYVSVTPYPAGMSPASPDVSNQFTYGNYASFLGIGSVTVLVNGVDAANTSVTIGSTLTIEATLTNTGNAPIQNYTSNLSYWLPPPFQPVRVAPTQAYLGLLAGDSKTVDFSWAINESVVGDHGTFVGLFLLGAAWNGGSGPNAGVATAFVNVTIAPSLINLTFSPPTGDLKVNQEYIGTGVITFNGSGDATINITLIASNGQSFEVSTSSVPNGTFTGSVIVGPIMPTGTYTVRVDASYNGRPASVTIVNAFNVPGPSAAPPDFLHQTFLGIPVLYWILIAIAAAGAIIGVLFLLRRTARGKVVECGECGALIPENATACPQCGAEFESDLVRCSRCGSTIPSNSQVCPECAAQLLGKAEDESRDPERQGYNDVVERFRAESKKELGDNYSEGAFWDWWKRQPTYLSFSQYRLQQAQGNRTGMGAPPPASQTGSAMPASAGAAAAAASTGAPAARRGTPPRAGPRPVTTAPAAAPAARPAPVAPPTSAAPAQPPAAAPVGGMKPCSNCGKEIPPEYLVCPFCGAVTQ